MLYYPYATYLSKFYAPENITSFHIGMSAFYIWLSLIFFIPTLTARLLRGRHHWFGGIIVRLVNLFILQIVFGLYYHQYMSSKITLSSVMLPGYETEFKIAFAIILFSFLILFVLPGFYLQRLLMLYELKAGKYLSADDTETTPTAHPDLLEFHIRGKRPLWVKICVILSAITIFGTSIFYSVDTPYPSAQAIELYKTYWLLPFLFVMFAFISDVVFVSGHRRGAFFTVRPARGVLFIVVCAVFAWTVPYGVFNKILPTYYRVVGENEHLIKTFVVLNKLPHEATQNCERGAYILDPLTGSPRSQKICNIPILVYQSIQPGSNIFISTIQSEMGYQLGQVVIPK